MLDWAMSIGIEGTFAEIHGKPTPRFWGVAKRLFNKIKSALGMENCQTMITGAAPMRQSTRKFFLQINISFMNGYGMSETSGPHTVTDPTLWTSYSPEYLKETGNIREGLQVFIENEDKEGKGEICMRGSLVNIQVVTDLWVTLKTKKKTRKQSIAKDLSILEMKVKSTRTEQSTSLEELKNSS